MSAGRENVYTCPACKRQLVTIDRHDGTTPMFMRCGGVNPPGCGAMMVSAGYPPGPRPPHIPAPSHEWYAPTPDELRRELAAEPYEYRAGIREHVRLGGLLIRPIAVGVPS